MITFFVVYILKKWRQLSRFRIRDQILEYFRVFFYVTIWYFTIVFSPSRPYKINQLFNNTFCFISAFSGPLCELFRESVLVTEDSQWMNVNSRKLLGQRSINKALVRHQMTVGGIGSRDVPDKPTCQPLC